MSHAILDALRVSHLTNISLMTLALLHMQHATTNVTNPARVTYSHTQCWAPQQEDLSYVCWSAKCESQEAATEVCGWPFPCWELSALQRQRSQLCSVNVLHEMSLTFAKAGNGRNSRSVALACWLTEGKLVTVKLSIKLPNSEIINSKFKSFNEVSKNHETCRF